jgi:hypothetical protein
MESKLEMWVAALGILVAGVVVTSWLMVGPLVPSRVDVAVIVAVVTAFGWAAVVVGGVAQTDADVMREVEPGPRRSVYGEIHC